MTVRQALADAERRLTAAGIETPRVDAEWLVAHVLGVSRSRLYEAGEVDAELLEPLLRRREAREPLAYVLGEWGFRGLTLKTDSRALVPRPETETLVERALALIRDSSAPRVLDVGVGGGAIALAIKAEHPQARVTGVDTAADALELARENAAALGLDVELRRSGFDAAADGWDLVVANPPYIPHGELASLQPELQWEPRQALVGNGLHKEIARVADTRAIAFEVGDGQADAVATSLAELGYERIAVTRDLAGTERVVEGRRG
ncbi:MAG TPA: peptide chain release factor N(5)-glutamine methyltransferase [Gaiellaceae bacterium]|nr:peptide chain release factor N(5)-glutamine methyltransferase [Gaiellaceae bacterium]